MCCTEVTPRTTRKDLQANVRRWSTYKHIHIQWAVADLTNAMNYYEWTLAGKHRCEQFNQWKRKLQPILPPSIPKNGILRFYDEHLESSSDISEAFQQKIKTTRASRTRKHKVLYSESIVQLI